MIVATSSSSSGFWNGVLCGAAVSAIVLTWLSNPSPPKTRKKDRTNKTKNRRGLGFLNRNAKIDPSFLTDIMEQMWPYMKIAGAETIRASVEPSFAALPGPMKTCRFTKLDLGDIPMSMDNILVHPLKPDGSIQFDLDLEWDGECDFRLKADYIGSFGVKHLKLMGRMAIILKPLTNELPVVSGIQYGFINMPTIDLSFSGLASVAELSLLESTVEEALQSSLSTTVLPNRRLYKMNDANNFLDTYQPPIGVLRLHVQRGKGFVIEKRFLAKDDIPDVYLSVSLGAVSDAWRTKTIEDNLNPKWNEVGDFCLYDREQLVQIHAWDEDKGPLDPDDDLGVASVTVADMLLSSKRAVTLPLKMHNRSKGVDEETGAKVTLSCEICKWTTNLSSLEESSDQTTDREIHNKICGLLVVIINRAFDLPLNQKSACTFVKVTHGGMEYDSKMIYDYPGWDSLNPIYETGITIPITTKMPRDDKATVQLDLINMEDEKSAIVGSFTIPFSSLKDIPDHTLTERRSIGHKGASLEYRVSLSGVSQPATNGSIDHRSDIISPATSFETRSLPRSPSMGNSVRFDLDDEPSAGTFKLTVVKARGLTIREELFGIDVPDVYFVVQFRGHTFITSVKHNNITPEWNESKHWKLLDEGQVLSIKGWDRNEREEDPDVAIGTVQTTIGNLLLAGGPVELELLSDKGLPSRVFVTLRAEMV